MKVPFLKSWQAAPGLAEGCQPPVVDFQSPRCLCHNGHCGDSSFRDWPQLRPVSHAPSWVAVSSLCLLVPSFSLLQRAHYPPASKRITRIRTPLLLASLSSWQFLKRRTASQRSSKGSICLQIICNWMSSSPSCPVLLWRPLARSWRGEKRGNLPSFSQLQIIRNYVHHGVPMLRPCQAQKRDQEHKYSETWTWDPMGPVATDQRTTNSVTNTFTLVCPISPRTGSYPAGGEALRWVPANRKPAPPLPHCSGHSLQISPRALL